jgi:hypothetical protein
MALRISDGWATTTSSTGHGGMYIYSDADLSVGVKKEVGDIQARFYFDLVKKRKSKIDTAFLEGKMKYLEKTVNKLLDAGQEAFADKLFKEIVVYTRELEIASRGVEYFVENEVLQKYKHRIKGGHISDTKFEDYTRVIPEDVLEAKKKTEGVFDGYVIYHYWKGDSADVKNMTSEEKSNMKDPILFGIIKDTRRLYLIADWEDEFCDLTFKEIIDCVTEEGGFEHPNEYKLKPEFKEENLE